MVSVCQLCEERAPKYKCPSCEIQYCSIACYEHHKMLCSDIRSISVAKTVSEKSLSSTKPKQSSAERHRQPLPRELAPSHPLLSSEHYRQLQSRYPKIRLQLHEIYDATLESSWCQGSRHKSSRQEDHYDRGHGRGGIPSKGRATRNLARWTRERGMMNGLGRFRKFIGSKEADGEGMREFRELVLKMGASDSTK